MVNLEMLKVFVCVAETKNITKASEQLFISQPAISATIKKLEQGLGCKLFERQRYGVELSPEGEEFYFKIKRLLAEIDDACEMVSTENQLDGGKLRIGTNSANISLILGKKIVDFCVKYPKIKIEIIKQSDADLQESLRNKKLDAIFIDKYVVPADVEVIKEYVVDYTIISGKEEKGVLSLDDISKRNFALISSKSSSNQNIVSYFKKYNIELKSPYIMENYALIMDIVKNNLALGIVNLDYFRREEAEKQIFVVRTNFKIDSRKFILATLKNSEKRLPLQKFLQNI